MGISILLCAYNEEANILATINSIKLNETSCDFEIVGIDNDSSDNTIKILEAECDVSIRCTERGKIPCLKVGVDNAKFQIIAIADADTIYPIHWIQDIYDAFENRNVQFVFGPVYNRDSNSDLDRKIFDIFCVLSLLFRVVPAVGFNMAIRARSLRCILDSYNGGALTGWGIGTEALRTFGQSSILFSKNIYVPKNMDRIHERGHIKSIMMWVGEWFRLATRRNLKIMESEYYGF